MKCAICSKQTNGVFNPAKGNAVLILIALIFIDYSHHLILLSMTKYIQPWLPLHLSTKELIKNFKVTLSFLLSQCYDPLYVIPEYHVLI